MNIQEMVTAAETELTSIQGQLIEKRAKRDALNEQIKALVAEEEEATRIVGALTRPKRTRKAKEGATDGTTPGSAGTSGPAAGGPAGATATAAG